VFEGLACRHQPISTGAAPHEVLAESAAEPYLRAGPARIFGVPQSPSCLDGVGANLAWLPPRRLVRLRDAAIVGHDMVLSGPHLWCPDPATTNERLSALADGHDHHGAVVLAGRDACCHFISRPQTERIAADAIFLHDPEPGNHGSFLFRVLPQLIVLAQHAPRFDCYVAADRGEALRAALHHLGLPPHPIHSVREVCGDLFRSVTMTNAFDAEGMLAASVLDGMRDLARKSARAADGATPRRIYVSRRHGVIARPWYRSLVNELEIEAIAGEQGFTAIRPETLGFAQQMALFANAPVIAGPSGSGLLNAVFAPQGSKILDLESFHVTVRQHANLYASSGKCFAFLFGQQTSDQGPDEFRPWQIDLALMRDGLDWLRA
jgi:capsular polysaccharide biosynthesis protein